MLSSSVQIPRSSLSETSRDIKSAFQWGRQYINKVNKQYGQRKSMSFNADGSHNNKWVFCLLYFKIFTALILKKYQIIFDCLLCLFCTESLIFLIKISASDCTYICKNTVYMYVCIFICCSTSYIMRNSQSSCLRTINDRLLTEKSFSRQCLIS